MTNEPLKATHTPLPWKVEEGHIQRDSNGIRYWQITDGQDAIACNQFCYAGYDPEVNEANAAFIVHAVNIHHDLIEALTDVGASLAAAISLLERGGKAVKKAAPSDRMFDQMVKDYKASLERTRAALKEAGRG